MKTKYQSTFQTVEEAAELSLKILSEKFVGGATQTMIKTEIEHTGARVGERKVYTALELLEKQKKVTSRQAWRAGGVRVYHLAKAR